MSPSWVNNDRGDLLWLQTKVVHDDKYRESLFTRAKRSSDDTESAESKIKWERIALLRFGFAGFDDTSWNATLLKLNFLPNNSHFSLFPSSSPDLYHLISSSLSHALSLCWYSLSVPPYLLVSRFSLPPIFLHHHPCSSKFRRGWR